MMALVAQPQRHAGFRALLGPVDDPLDTSDLKAITAEDADAAQRSPVVAGSAAAAAIGPAPPEPVPVASASMPAADHPTPQPAPVASADRPAPQNPSSAAAAGLGSEWVVVPKSS